ncbi:hypothetical protein RZS08_45540, partial [Arthrospira platensis SPKY1]|nr:hypothetical protein [Arthrospira platensis SPKY1]
QATRVSGEARGHGRPPRRVAPSKVSPLGGQQPASAAERGGHVLPDPQPDRIPGATKDAALLDGLQHRQGHFDHRLAVRQSHAQRAERLAALQGGHQGLGAYHLGLQAGALAGGHSDHHTLGQTQAHIGGLALPDLGTHQGL